MSSEPETGARRARRKRRSLLRSLVFYAAVMGGAFVAGVLLFNLVIMPAFVGHREEVLVPNVMGKELLVAEKMISDAGLGLGDTRRRHDARPAGTIVAQHPAAGTSVKAERSVVLVVSLGERGSLVPDLHGQTQRNAELALSSADLAPGRVLEVPSEEVEPGTVIASEPPAGSSLAPGTGVNLLVSSGRPGFAYLMPDLRGLDAYEVERRLTDAGFKVEIDNTGRSIGSRRRIEDHDPGPGASLSPGGWITLHAN